MSNEMTLSELKQIKEITEKEIRQYVANKVEEFQGLTGVPVRGVNFYVADRATLGGGQYGQVIDAKLEIRLV